MSDAEETGRHERGEQADFSRFSGLEVKPGTLYIVSTPVGNLEDISYRALYTLQNADIIAAEDTRVTNILLKHYGISTRSISYYSQVEGAKTEYIINLLKEGNAVALVSDAGTPCISDPGSILVSQCVENEIDVISIPGASSLIHALVVSGFSSKKFYFQGFLPQKKGRETLFKELKELDMPVVIFESPFRVQRTLNDILKHMGNREISVSREMTKKFETTVRGRVKDIVKDNKVKTKGEFVIVINN